MHAGGFIPAHSGDGFEASSSTSELFFTVSIRALTWKCRSEGENGANSQVEISSEVNVG